MKKSEFFRNFFGKGKLVDYVTPTKKPVYQFGEFQLDTNRYVLLRKGRPVPLTPKLFDVLLVLVENSGDLVLKEEFLERVWKESFVEEGNLNRHISSLRKALGESSTNPKFIETVPKRGFRFKAPVTTVGGRSGDKITAPSRSPVLWARLGVLVPAAAVAVLVYFLVVRDVPISADVKSLAVLPLNNFSGDPEQEYFSDGMTEALISNLGMIAGLRVISRTSVMRYKETQRPLPEIARELNVDAVVEGSSLLVGEHVRVTVQLIEAATDHQLWSRSYEGDLRDILTLQREVASAIAQEIEVRLTPREQSRLASPQPVNPDAHLAYLKGRYHWNRRTLEEAFEYFNQAVSIDPDDPLAYSGRADCYHKLGVSHIVPPSEAFPRAKAAAMRALEIDDQLSEAYTPLGFMLTNYDWNWPEAERVFSRAIELNPSYPGTHEGYAWLLTILGRTAEAVAEAERALDLNPYSYAQTAQLGLTLYFVRRYDRAREQLRMVLDRVPEKLVPAPVINIFAMAYLQEGMVDEAISEIQRGRTRLPGSPDLLAFLGYAYAVAGKGTEAARVIEELKEGKGLSENYVLPFYLALIYTGLGEVDLALEWLEKGYQNRVWMMVFIGMEPAFDPLRSDPRFQDLLARMNLKH